MQVRLPGGLEEIYGSSYFQVEFFSVSGESFGLPAPGCFKAGPEQEAGGGDHLAGSREGLGRRVVVVEFCSKGGMRRVGFCWY